jgi:hypothetical protein
MENQAKQADLKSMPSPTVKMTGSIVAALIRGALAHPLPVTAILRPYLLFTQFMSSQLHPMLNVAIKAARTAGAIINRAALDVESVRVSAKADQRLRH